MFFSILKPLFFCEYLKDSLDSDMGIKGRKDSA